MKRFLSKLLSRRGLIAVCVVVIALIVIRPQADRVRWRVSQSISAAIGKRVQIGSLHLRFLPRLGFELDDFVVYDDPAISSEPLLRAQDVTAALRVTSLLRGRFEVSNLSLNNASLNLTRDSQSRWNLEDLLQRTAQISTAPTSSSYRESRPEFPYIEASHARVNFKVGAEKTHFALTDAEFALWQESEGVWGMRLKARPIRTDANLTDTGVLNVNGSWSRGVAAETPIEVTFQWKQAQAGQVSKLFTGEDKGWRGGVMISGGFSGTSRELKLVADASIDDLGRYDIFNNETLAIATHCVAQYNFPENSVSGLACSSPVGSGDLELKGEARGPAFSVYGFKLTTNQVPVQSLVTLLQHTVATVPQNLSVKGIVNSSIELSRTSGDEVAAWKGSGEFVDPEIARGNGPSFPLGRVPFNVVEGTKPNMELGPVNIGLGRASPILAHATISAAGYQAAIRGEANVQRLLQLASAFGVSVPAVVADGPSNVDLAIRGNWNDGRPVAIGTAQLHNVRAQVRGLNAPLELRTANMTLATDAVRVQNINAVAAETQWRGSILVPRPCPTPRDCTLQFNLRATEVNSTSLNKLLNPAARKQSWYKLLSFGEKTIPYLLQARASGKISIDQLVLGNAISDQFSSSLILDQGKLTLSGFRCSALGGRITGEWKADFTAKPPVYAGNGSIEGVALDQISDLMRNNWIEGTGSAGYEFKTQGWSLQDLIASLDLDASFAVRDGRFPRIALTSKSGALRVKSFEGKMAFKNGDFSFEDAKLSAPEGIYTVSGTASLGGVLKLKMMNEGASGYDVSGTLTQTRISQLATTSARASLKP